MAKVSLKREGNGEYTTKDGNYCIRNPHSIDPSDPDRKWYMFKCFNNDIFGPFDTLKEVRELIREKGLA